MKNWKKLRLYAKSVSKSIESAKSMKKHMKNIHPTQIGCFVCALSFTKNSDLEAHIEECHESSSRYNCDQCNKKFVLEWRLKKHQESHSSDGNKFCHYFNNHKPCPYEKIGCMFLHQHSKICYFRAKCRNKLCQFKHFENGKNDSIDEFTKQFEKLTRKERI